MYQSTRGKGEPVTASQAILKGLSEDGGLFVPTQIPALDVSMDELSRMTYQETAYQVMSRLLTDFTEEELRTCINRAYDKKFDTDVIAPLLRKLTGHIIWNFSMVLQLHLKTWHFPFCHIL